MPAFLLGGSCSAVLCDGVAWRDGLCRQCWAHQRREPVEQDHNPDGPSREALERMFAAPACPTVETPSRHHPPVGTDDTHRPSPSSHEGSPVK